MSNDAAVAVPDVEETVQAAPQTAEPARKPKRQPRYHVLLWNDEDHTYEYVIVMLHELFGHPPEKGFQIAQEVDLRGKAIVLTPVARGAEVKDFDRDRDRVRGARRITEPPSIGVRMVLAEG